MTDELRMTGLLAGLPPIPADTPWVKVLEKVYVQMQLKTLAYADKLRIYTHLDDVSEEVLDVLAVQFKVDWYDQSWKAETKRSVIKTSLEVRRFYGTGWATEKAIATVYPGSKIVEWYNYKGARGTPGHFVVECDISSDREQLDVAELERVVNIYKRMTAHLDAVHCIVRHTIELGHETKMWLAYPPLCGTIRCGTWWMPSTLGWSENRTVQAAGRAEGFEVWPELTGTLPEISTVGYSACGAVRCGGQVTGHEISPPPADTVKCGTEWMPAALGWSAAGTMQAAAEAEVNLGCPDLAGTLPTVSKIGYSVTVPAEASADAQLHTTELPESGTSPCGMKP